MYRNESGQRVTLPAANTSLHFSRAKVTPGCKPRPERGNSFRLWKNILTVSERNGAKLTKMKARIDTVRVVHSTVRPHASGRELTGVAGWHGPAPQLLKGKYMKFCHCRTKKPAQSFQWISCETCKATFAVIRLSRIPTVLPVLLIALLCLTACGKNKQDQPSNAQAVADAFAIHSHCQLQSVVPAPQYGAGVNLKTYLCSQYSPSCFVSVLSSPAFDQVPAIVTNTCPQNPVTGQVPP